MTRRLRKLQRRALENCQAGASVADPGCVRTLIMATTAMTVLSAGAEAQQKRFFAEAAYSTSVLDRGEQIGTGAVEWDVGAEILVGDFAPFVSIYRRTPVGPHRDAYDGETDYTLGMTAETTAFAASFAANWLTYPGEDTNPSLEWTGAVEFAHVLAPAIAGFYDADSGDAGLEVSAGPEWQAGDWTAYAILRAGFVHPAESADRSYAGIEIGAARQVTASTDFGIFVRGELADEDGYARQFGAAGVTQFREAGFAVGIALSLSN